MKNPLNIIYPILWQSLSQMILLRYTFQELKSIREKILFHGNYQIFLLNFEELKVKECL